MLQCVACGGTFEPTLPDGTRYFHACAPVWNAAQRKFLERVDKRDENVTGGKDARGVAIMKAVGKGVLTV